MTTKGKRKGMELTEVSRKRLAARRTARKDRMACPMPRWLKDMPTDLTDPDVEDDAPFADLTVSDWR
jgi:hypothetical protein